ncbi:SulP family inorganic anion transporter [Streptosporangium album]
MKPTVGLLPVGYTDNILTARHDYEIDANQELLALGVTNISAGLTCGFPISSSGSRRPARITWPLSPSSSSVTIAVDSTRRPSPPSARRAMTLVAGTPGSVRLMGPSPLPGRRRGEKYGRKPRLQETGTWPHTASSPAAAIGSSAR